MHYAVEFKAYVCVTTQTDTLKEKTMSGLGQKQNPKQNKTHNHNNDPALKKIQNSVICRILNFSLVKSSRGLGINKQTKKINPTVFTSRKSIKIAQTKRN